MQDIILWCQKMILLINENQGFLMVALTLVYVLATIAIFQSNNKSASASEKQTIEIKKQYEEMNRAKIDIKFEIIRGGLLCFVIENLGNKPAHNISINICEKFIQCLEDELSIKCIESINNGTFYLAVNQKITVFIGSKLKFDKIASTPAAFNIKYNDKYEEKIIIDINQYSYMLIYNSPMEDISQHLQQMKEQQHSFQRNFLKQHETLSKKPISILNISDGNNSLKFKVYKTVCILRDGTLKAIAEKSDIDIIITHEILCELFRVDRLVHTYLYGDPMTLNEETIWIRS